MGAAPSLAKFLRSMEDDELVSLVEDAYHLDPQRIERVFALAKMRYIERTKSSPVRGDAAESAKSDQAPALAAFPAASSLTEAAVAPASSSSSSSVATAAASLLPKEMSSLLPASIDEQQQQQVSRTHDKATGSAAASALSAMENAVLNAGKDPMNALWSFDGHTLRELLPLDKNPQHASQQQQQHPSGSDGDDSTASSGAKQLDDDGQPLLYGSCGRDKRYARCSVCYFRGLRSNSAHYCSCCQRPVCIRPRKYPNEEHAKICWNVLHMDKDMVSRVEKKKRRRLHAALGAPSAGGLTLTATAEHSTLRVGDAPSYSPPHRPSAAAAAAVAVATAALDL